MADTISAAIVLVVFMAIVIGVYALNNRINKMWGGDDE